MTLQFQHYLPNITVNCIVLGIFLLFTSCAITAISYTKIQFSELFNDHKLKNPEKRRHSFLVCYICAGLYIYGFMGIRVKVKVLHVFFVP